VAYYELFDNYLVFYWMGFAPNETKTINLDLKANIQGNYKAKASNTYLYYTPEYKHWADGVAVEIGH
jgi:alpha-2-macroglobulin-like protein